MNPQDFVDDVSVNFRQLLELMNISNDHFIRTTDEGHKKSVQVSFKMSSCFPLLYYHSHLDAFSQTYSAE